MAPILLKLMEWSDVYTVLMHHTAGITSASGPARWAAGHRSVLQT